MEKDNKLISIDEYKLHINHLNIHINDLNNEINNHKETIREIYNSKSWTITKPLRKIYELVKFKKKQKRESKAQLLEKYIKLNNLKFKNHTKWYDSKNPMVSLVVLNYNKPDYTLECIKSIFEKTESFSYEIVLVDNGSTAESKECFNAISQRVKYINLSENRFFGEGNNIGFEFCSGEYIVFMNNDITTTDNWLQPLISKLKNNDSVGAVGPKLVYPDGRLQEAGADITPLGESIQFGKGKNPFDSIYNIEKSVTYVSAACVALRKTTFKSVLGFDLMFEPAYYEDSDLCLKIKQLGLEIIYIPSSTIIHHENVTSREFSSQLKIHSVIASNKEKFLTRWAEYLNNKTFPPILKNYSSDLEIKYYDEKKNILMYTPYPLTPGGGERYFLTICSLLSEQYNVFLKTPEIYSRIRLLTLGRELNINLTKIHNGNTSKYKNIPFQYSFLLGNELFPTIKLNALINFYICQFPFPQNRTSLDNTKDNIKIIKSVILYSNFVKECFDTKIQEREISITSKIIPPPTNLYNLTRDDFHTKTKSIISVGRFFIGGHNKRHDLIIKAFKLLHKIDSDIELHLVGSVPSDPVHLSHLNQLKESASNYPIYFHINSSPENLEYLYRKSSLYWHMAGFEINVQTEPHKCEHFGISIVEAMSAGCVVMAYDAGGPASLINHGSNGYKFTNLTELTTLSADILLERICTKKITILRNNAINYSRNYSTEIFQANIKNLISEST
jgi:GT2 family glycosyltransferase/glycosyltransferase involved in cell wall biosynthesis